MRSQRLLAVAALLLVVGAAAAAHGRVSIASHHRHSRRLFQARNATTGANATAKAAPKAAPAPKAAAPMAPWDYVNGTARGNFTIFRAALNATGLVAYSQNATNFVNTTIFVPTDTAFLSLLREINVTAEALLADVNTTLAVLSYHILPIGRKLAANFSSSPGEWYADADGDWLTVERDANGTVFVTDQIGRTARVVSANNLIGNTSVIHTVDRVLLPYTPTSIVDLLTTWHSSVSSTLVSAVALSPLVLGEASSPTANYTLFAPINSAFAWAMNNSYLGADDLVEDRATSILLCHILPRGTFLEEIANNTVLQPLNPNCTLTYTIIGGQPFLLGGGEAAGWVASFTMVDLKGNAAGSVVHFIDTVIIPYPVPPPVAPTTSRPRSSFSSVYDLVSNRKDLSITKQVIEYLNWTEIASTSFEGWTGFLPTDSAWMDLYTWLGTSADAVLYNTTILSAIVEVHFWEIGAQRASAVPNTPGIKLTDPATGTYITVERDYLGRILLTDQTGHVGQATRVNIPTGLGISHIIDKVMLPYNSSYVLDVIDTFWAPNPELRNGQGLSALAGALKSFPAILAVATDPTTNLTLLAPNDAAWVNAYVQGWLSDATTNDTFIEILGCHVIPAGGFGGWAVPSGTVFGTLVPGCEYMIVEAGLDLYLVGLNRLAGQWAEVVVDDIKASAGGSVINIIDDIFIPLPAELVAPTPDTTAPSPSPDAAAPAPAEGTGARRRQRMLAELNEEDLQAQLDQVKALIDRATPTMMRHPPIRRRV